MKALILVCRIAYWRLMSRLCMGMYSFGEACESWYARNTPLTRVYDDRLDEIRDELPEIRKGEV